MISSSLIFLFLFAMPVSPGGGIIDILYAAGRMP